MVEDVTSVQASTEGVDGIGKWKSVVEDLTEIDRRISEIRDELRQFESRRERLAHREKALRPEGDAPPTASWTDEEAIMKTKEKCETVMYDLDDQDAASEGETPKHAVTGSKPLEVEPPVEAIQEAEDMERYLATLGVARCGVCGMKLPLDVESIEEHSLKCEAAQLDGKKLPPPDPKDVAG